MSFFQYLNDTRGELRHVAWPTRLQTIVYTILVIVISVAIAFYLGFFDYVFTNGLSHLVEFLPANSSFVPSDISTTTTEIATSTAE